ncbi:MAG TPA: hydrogen peroxide-inducible genes activator [Chitinophagaceae bacterium]|nr:hydrogen peroxide-inducible genes activator [Chitinophagaceae bacterium]HNF49524.1 hydrogen peroxide-inducible genes activator [Chitinophagales bacterium]HNL83917.1 hydrogen peroxide-inducible genes activator [Chitinophagales bacterium]
MNFSLTQLEYVLAIDNYRHFAKAADACLVTQPTLSMQLKKLEEELGFELFDRTKQPIIPTDAGKIIIEQARTILRETKKLEHIAQTFDNSFDGNFSVGIIPTIAPYLLPYFLGDFIKKYPNIRLHLQELKTEEIIFKLNKDELDAGILATPLHESNLIEEPVFYEEIKLYAHYKHLLSNKKNLKPDDIMRPDIWMLTEGNCFRNQIINICTQPQEITKHLHYDSGSLETLKKMVDMEGGFTLLPELAVLELSNKKQEQISEFRKPKPLREISLVYARSVAKMKYIHVLKKLIQESIPDYLQNKKRGTVVEWK